jgi:hypothetical protein
VSGVAPTTGITLSDEDVGDNARSAADMEEFGASWTLSGRRAGRDVLSE